MKWYTGKKRLIKKALGRYYFRLYSDLYDNMTPAQLPKVGDLTCDCDGSNHVIAEVEYRWEPLRIYRCGWAYIEGGKSLPYGNGLAGRVLRLHVKYENDSGQLVHPCFCEYDMAYQPPAPRKEIVRCQVERYRFLVRVINGEEYVGSNYDLYEKAFNDLLAQGVRTEADIEKLIDENGVWLKVAAEV